MNHWTSTALHEELASFYQQYRGVPAPSNTFTTNLWNKIEEVEADEKRIRELRRTRATK